MRLYHLLMIAGITFALDGMVRADSLYPRGSKRFDVMAWEYQLPGYAGPIFRPVINLKGPSTTLMSFGIDGGYKWFGLGFRYAYKSSVNYLIPDIRFSYPLHLGRRLFLEPLVEFSPMFATGGGAKMLQLVIRPGVRLGFMFSPSLALIFEPFLFDLGVYTHAWSSGFSATSNDFFLNYTLGFALQYRFR